MQVDTYISLEGFHMNAMSVSNRRQQFFHGNNKGEIHDDVIKWKHIPRYWPFVR